MCRGYVQSKPCHMGNAASHMGNTFVSRLTPPLPPLPGATDDMLGWSPSGGLQSTSAANATATALAGRPRVDPRLFSGFSQQLCDAYGFGNISYLYQGA